MPFVVTDSNEDFRYITSDSKYTFYKKKGDHRVKVLRYNEEWLEFEQGSEAIITLISDFEDTDEQLKQIIY